MVHKCTYPLQAKLEIVQGCNHDCFFCGVTHKKDKKYKFMEIETLKEIVSKLPERTKRLDFELHGEPLLNKNVLMFIEYARKEKPLLQITIISNVKMIKNIDQINDLFNAGLNNLYADLYTEKIKDNFLQIIKERSKDIKVIDIYKGDDSPWGYKGSKNKKIFLSDETIITNRSLRKSRQLNNFGGNLPYAIWSKYIDAHLNDFPVMRKCIEPFKSLTIDYQGNIFLCCMDLYKSLIMGNVYNDTIENIWNNELFMKIRYVLNQGRRDLVPTCYFCDRITYRVGLYGYFGRKYSLSEIEEISKRTNLSEYVKQLFEMREQWYTLT